jgi:hypothetical protein
MATKSFEMMRGRGRKTTAAGLFLRGRTDCTFRGAGPKKGRGREGEPGSFGTGEGRCKKRGPGGFMGNMIGWLAHPKPLDSP